MTKAPAFTRCYIDLAQPRLGAEVLEASDDFFAPKHRLIKPEEPVFIADKYDDHGKWMDGWESRRRRSGGHDYCLIKLCPGVIAGVEIDTRYFTGNYPPRASIEACRSETTPGADTRWTEILSAVELKGDSRQFYPIQSLETWSHLRLHIYPDGGVARLRVFGEAHCDWSLRGGDETMDLAAMENGGRVLACNDMHYGDMRNIIAPGKAINMGDGWETRRRRTQGNDWVILKLGHPGSIERVEIDTAHFKGNYPERCCLKGTLLENLAEENIGANGDYWRQLLPKQSLEADRVHQFSRELRDTDPVSHVLLSIYPDGGVSRLRLWGKPWRP